MRRLLLSFLSVPLVLAAQQPNTFAATMTVDGQNGPTFPTNVTVRTNTVSNLGLTGFPNAPFLVGVSATGNTQLFSAAIYGGKLDLPLNPPSLPWLNGLFGPGIATFKLNVFGGYNFPVSILSNAPINSTAAMQALVTDPSSPFGYSLTAATKTTMTLGPVLTNYALGGGGIIAVNLTGWTFPFYGTNYTSLHVCADGYMTMGAAQSDFSSSPAQLTSGLPRIAGFWADLDQAFNGIIRSTVDATPPGDFPYVLVEFINVVDWSGVGFSHTFSWRVNDQGEVRIISDYANNLSIFETMVAIAPGLNINSSVSMRNFTDIQDLTGYAIGALNANFYEWFGQTTMPTYSLNINNPYDLIGRTLTFVPNSSATTLVGSTTSYFLY